MDNETKPPTAMWVRLLERSLAGAALIGAALYVFLQALYIEFYDDFGIRPEQVGLDRTAVLSRAAWAALAALLALGIIGSFYAYIKLIRGNSDFKGPAQKFKGWREEAQGRRRRNIIDATALLIFCIILIIIGLGFLRLMQEVERLAGEVTKGHSVAGIKYIVPMVDVRAHPARVTWLEEKDGAAPPVGDPEVMYLGRGDDVAAFYTGDCSTILLPAGDIKIQLLDQGPEVEPGDVQLNWNPETCSPAGG